MAGRKLIVTIILLICLISCGSDTTPVTPDTVPQSKTAFLGKWQGTLSRVAFNSINFFDTLEFKSNVNCSVKFDLFQCTLELIDLEDHRETMYSLTGDWKWDASDPRTLVFYNHQESMVRVLEFRGIKRTFHSTLEDGDVWDCKVQFMDDFNRLLIFDLGKRPGLSKFPDSSEISLIRNN